MVLKREIMFVALLISFGVSITFAEGIDVTFTPPGITFTGGGLNITIPTDDLETELAALEAELENDPELQNFAEQEELARGFANAGAASTHLATQRSFSDYRVFALVLGTGVGIAAPSPSVGAIEDSMSEFEEEGDAYFGLAMQPIAGSLGFNLSRWVDRLRVNGKFGYFKISDDSLVDDITFSSLMLGVGADYQIVQTRSILAGVLKWRGVSLGTGVNYQSNKTELTVEVQEAAFEESFTYADVGIPINPNDPLDPDAVNDTLATLTVSPTIEASVESRSISVPLEVSTGLRLLYLFDFNVGAGVDFAFGGSEVAFGAESEINVVPDPDAAQYLQTTPGKVDLGVSTKSKPQLLRPRLTAGVGLNLGPIKVDVPLMYYFDTDGPTAMVGVNLGIVW